MLTFTRRFGLPKWGDPAVDGPTHDQFNNMSDSLDRYASHDDQGALSARPPAGKQGNYYFATDTKCLYRDDGTQWRAVAGNIDGPVTVNGTLNAGLVNVPGYSNMGYIHITGGVYTGDQSTAQIAGVIIPTMWPTLAALRAAMPTAPNGSIAYVNTNPGRYYAFINAADGSGQSWVQIASVPDTPPLNYSRDSTYTQGNVDNNSLTYLDGVADTTIKTISSGGVTQPWAAGIYTNHDIGCFHDVSHAVWAQDGSAGYTRRAVIQINPAGTTGWTGVSTGEGSDAGIVSTYWSGWVDHNDQIRFGTLQASSRTRNMQGRVFVGRRAY